MSGDVQPRKRKDKRKKKDESLEYLNSSPDDIIHVQKDAFLGGNICSRVVFFCLLGALGVMVSFLIFEYRGSNDLETQSALDSPWSQMLEGWIDTSIDANHDDHHEDNEDDDDDNDDDDHDDDDDNDFGNRNKDNKNGDNVKHERLKKDQGGSKTKIQTTFKLEKDDDDDDYKDSIKSIYGDSIMSILTEQIEEAEGEGEETSEKDDVDDNDDEDEDDDDDYDKDSTKSIYGNSMMSVITQQSVEQIEEAEGEEEETSGSAADSTVKEVTANESISAVPKPETPELLSQRKSLVPPSFTEDIDSLRSPSPLPDEYSEDEGEEEEDDDEEEGSVDETEHVNQTLDDLKAAYAEITPEPSDIEEDYQRDPVAKAYDYNETPPESEPEQSEPEEEADDYNGEGDEDEEEEDDPRSQWQSKQAAGLLAEEVEDLQTGSEEEEEDLESDDEPPPPPQTVVRRRGPQDIDENEQFFQDLVFETFEKAEQPLQQHADKSDQSGKDEELVADEVFSDSVKEVENENAIEYEQDLWEPVTSTESHVETAAEDDKFDEIEPAEESEVDQESPVKDYFNSEITNDYDWEIHDDLDAADAELNEGDFNFI